MVIKDVQIVESGEAAGDLVVSVIAKRHGREHRLPYQIGARNINTVDLEYLKQKVLDDVDALEAATSKQNVVIGKLREMQGKTINLD